MSGLQVASGGLTAVQDILSWSYSPVPISGLTFSNGFAASGSQLTLNGGAALEWKQASADRRQRE